MMNPNRCPRWRDEPPANRSRSPSSGRGGLLLVVCFQDATLLQSRLYYLYGQPRRSATVSRQHHATYLLDCQRYAPQAASGLLLVTLHRSRAHSRSIRGYKSWEEKYHPRSLWCTSRPTAKRIEALPCSAFDGWIHSMLLCCTLAAERVKE